MLNTGKRQAMVFAVIFIVVVGAWWFLGYGPSSQYVGWGRGIKSLEDAGSFGDSFGYVNSLFSALAFAGVVIAILLELHEIRESRIEQVEVKKAMAMQADSLFLSTYFDVERRYLEQANALDELRRTPHNAAERHIFDIQVQQITRVLEKLGPTYAIMEPHAQRILTRMGEIVGGGVRVHVV